MEDARRTGAYAGGVWGERGRGANLFFKMKLRYRSEIVFYIFLTMWRGKKLEDSFSSFLLETGTAPSVCKY